VNRLFRRHRWWAISPIAIDVTVCMFGCLSITFVHCAQTAEDIDTISLAYDCLITLPDHVIWLTSVYPFLPKFLPQMWSTRPPPVDLSVGDIRWQAQCSEIVQWSQWRAYRKPPSLFWMVPSLAIWLPQPPSPKMEVGDVAFCQITLALVSKSVRFIAFCFRHNAFCR